MVVNRIEIRKVHIEDIVNLYPEIYKSVFEEVDTFQMPSLIYLGFKNGELAGFISGYLHNAITFYLQYAGMLESKRGFMTVEMFREGLREIDKDFIYIMTVIKHSNIPAIKLALNERFVINGVRQDTGGRLFVEMIRTRG